MRGCDGPPQRHSPKPFRRMPTIDESPLFKYLAAGDPVLLGRATELREVAQRWLEYVPRTFPHYTQHTVAHSDHIIWQLSNLLFGQSNEPTVALSNLETYVLIAAAYLHDSGMVSSDTDKLRLMQTQDWAEFISDGPARDRWRMIEELRASERPTRDTAHFLADVQLRFLLAEFIRRTHHSRSASIVMEEGEQFAQFAFDDPTLLRTIAAVCRAHGLLARELDDDADYPDRRTIRGEQVNVRFMAVLLRIGDLLDLEADRACPLILNAACPLPADSFAHWTQYQRITHRMVAPDQIELTAECEAQEEHRFLTDWCSWLVDELHSAGWLMLRAARHGGWQPPHAAIADPGRTISITPSADASYVPTDWKLTVDEESVLERLIHDTYGFRTAFVRELIPLDRAWQ